ncbi:MAG: DUF5320 domain-containing protein [Candidatus Omnitrophica bacterium]|nr:DUF5320 domain-containing protein [Candidatus Omnitrophota bacterium]
MPGGDRTGPTGMGPMTGRGAGRCSGFPISGYANTMPGGSFSRGRGFGRGFGRGLGFRWMNPFASRVAFSTQDEAAMLKTQASLMQNEINSINDRIKELESRAPTS